MTDIHKQVTQHPRQRCYFCGSEGPIESHHIIPRRFNGPTNDRNLVDLCANCHKKIERLYDEQFYNVLGVTELDEGQDKFDIDMWSKVWGKKGYTYKEDCIRKEIEHQIEVLAESWNYGAPINKVLGRTMNEICFESLPIQQTYNKMKKKNDVYEPKEGYLRIT